MATPNDDTAPKRRPLQSVRAIISGVLEADPVVIERTARELGSTRRLLAPLAFVAGTLALMIVGVKPIIKNWRLMLVELVPAAWIWLSMWNLKSHVLDQRGVHPVHGWWNVAAAALFVAVAIFAFWCNALFIFAFSETPPTLRPAVPKVREHLRTILAWGVVVGSLQSFVTLWVSHQSQALYDIAQSLVVGLMMVTFVTVPASLAGYGNRRRQPRERIATAAVGSTLAVVASTPGFVLDRLGLLLIGTRFKILGFALLSLGVALEVAATSSTRAVKLSTRLVASDASSEPVSDEEAG